MLATCTAHAVISDFYCGDCGGVIVAVVVDIVIDIVVVLVLLLLLLFLSTKMSRSGLCDGHCMRRRELHSTASSQHSNFSINNHNATAQKQEQKQLVV